MTVSVLLWTLAYMLGQVQREMVGLVVAGLYAPLACIVIVTVASWASHFRVAAIGALLLMYPVRAFAILVVSGELAAAFAGQAPLALFEWLVGALMVLFAGSPLVRVTKEVRPGLLALSGILAFGVTAASTTLVMLVAKFEIVEMIRFGTSNRTPWLLVTGGLFVTYVLTAACLSLASTPRSAPIVVWLGAMLGSLAPGLLWLAMEGLFSFPPLLVGVPMVWVAFLALPPCIIGAVLPWLWRLAFSESEEDPALG